MTPVAAAGARAVGSTIMSTARSVLATASPQLKSFAKQQLDAAGFKSAARSLSFGGQDGSAAAAVALQALGTADANLARTIELSLANVMDDAGAAAIVGAFRGQAQQMITNAQSHVTNTQGVGTGDQMAKMTLITQAARVVGGVENLAVLVVAMANLRPTDLTEYRAARKALNGR